MFQLISNISFIIKFAPLFVLLFFTSLAVGGESITYQFKDQEFEGYAVKKKKAPMILLVHDWDGLTDYEIKRANMLGELGYSVFAVDLFGKGVRPKEDKDRRQHTGELYKDRKKMRDLLNAGIKAAQDNGINTKKTVVAGYCFGGAAVLELARSGADLEAFVTFHGGLETPSGQNYKNTKGEILVFHGTADSAIPMDQFSSLASELEKVKIPHEMITYGGAPHAFTVFGSNRYHKEADMKSWARFVDFLKAKF